MPPGIPKSIKEHPLATRAVSSWSLHRTLGRFVGPDSAATGGPFMEPPAQATGLSLLDLPEALRDHGYDTLHLCHFHLPDRSPAYTSEFRAAMEASGIELDVLLIDDGDLTSEDADGVEAWIGDWLDTAVALGARRARVGAGKAEPTPEVIRSSATRLARLAEQHPGVRVVTENWWTTMRDADVVLDVLGQAGDSVGLLIDLGNWSGSNKYEQLARITPLAETCHAKCRFTTSGPDSEDYRTSLQVLKDAGFDGPLALIYDGPNDDEWACLEIEHELVQEVFSEKVA
jgi:sugar phosphate isomerase/epimerase